MTHFRYKAWLILSFLILICEFLLAQNLIPFGGGGQLKMIYDRRQRPQALFLKNNVYLVYNGGAAPTAVKRNHTYPFITGYNLSDKSLSEPIKLDEKGSSDQHFCPIIWMGNSGHIHVLYGNHRTPGTHLIAKEKGKIGDEKSDWEIGAEVGSSMSYPTIYNIYANKKLVYYRTHEHRSSWTYRISDNDGKTWSGPENDVVDLNMGSNLLDIPTVEMNEASSYHTSLPGMDGKFLHVVFCYYDDNKSNAPEKFYNPRYETRKNFSFKFNLYYMKIDLRTNEVSNFDGEKLSTPIDLKTANNKCKIWDTAWRGAGIPPDILLDENENPAFLHVLSEDTPEQFNYYYYRNVDGIWKASVITASNDDWNSCYLRRTDNDDLIATLITGDGVELMKGKMDSRGGGNVEEWKSVDNGFTWTKNRDIVKAIGEYRGWKFNNVQPVKDANGEEIEGLLLFYGWQNSELPDGKGFLWIDQSFETQK